MESESQAKWVGFGKWVVGLLKDVNIGKIAIPCRLTPGSIICVMSDVQPTREMPNSQP
jgi:hypothetical protein